ncbi:Hypothetical predicted protein [Pelobates cultripes]|uniref:Uncharacterized protein n=1 Tax=Pelobates cultripes TaxID=61616 RepID=A0AAD1RNS1_PELCU|nr:Hypothetical predicted protein [Pelobates cultripes]
MTKSVIYSFIRHHESLTYPPPKQRKWNTKEDGGCCGTGTLGTSNNHHSGHFWAFYNLSVAPPLKFPLSWMTSLTSLPTRICYTAFYSVLSQLERGSYVWGGELYFI